MDKADVIDLLAEIKEEYRHFDVSDESIERHLKYLYDIPFNTAMKNVEQHIATNSRFPPGIADIRGRLGEQLDRQRQREETETYLAQIEHWRENAAPPPAGNRDKVMAILRGETG
ncbi:hypothetical protein FE783_12810 [Paenibacillus mesophilus]|uniref:replicative helicase loader/inhibitor n=1 Tax=Paenibacillus mesophilus TaxID=2582849 RepID=UPI00110F2C7D|nr:replicative helicase loader/inhibitor [Paenibacillus mesophilus]TMV49388.1 hypothetical protein FE783_12810 [Paenibacillus mesophilus]